MSVLSDYPDYSPHVAHADQIAATGVPLLTKSTLVYRVAIPSIGAGLAPNSGILPISQTGYEILVSAQAGAGSTNPYGKVYLQWIDSTTGFIVATDTFYTLQAVESGGFVIAGRGPTKADQVEITVQNYDTVTSGAWTITMLQNSRVYPADTWGFANFADNGRTIPGQTLAGLPGDETSLGVVQGISVPAGGNGTWLFGLATGGPVQLGVAFGGVTPANIHVHIFPIPTGNYSGQKDLADYAISDLGAAITFNPPRAPVAVQLINLATSGTLTGDMVMVRTLC